MKDLEIQKDVSLKMKTSWQVGGSAHFYCEPASVPEFISAVRWAQENHHPMTLLSGGSNVLIADEGLPGLVIGFGNWKGVEISEERGRLQIAAKAGTSKYELLKIFLKQKLAPAVFLAGIPGDVGGGVVMNAGVGESLCPREFVEIVDWVEVLNFQTHDLRRYSKEELQWSYRRCQGWGPGIILNVGLSWSLERDESILEKVRGANRVRLQKQPLDLPSCGSVFVNPPGFKVAQLIESCGLKGRRVGQAQVSLKHANFIVNLGGASAQDIRELISQIQQIVYEKTQVAIKTEVIFLGFSLLD